MFGTSKTTKSAKSAEKKNQQQQQQQQRPESDQQSPQRIFWKDDEDEGSTSISNSDSSSSEEDYATPATTDADNDMGVEDVAEDDKDKDSVSNNNNNNNNNTSNEIKTKTPEKEPRQATDMEESSDNEDDAMKEDLEEGSNIDGENNSNNEVQATKRNQILKSLLVNDRSPNQKRPGSAKKGNSKDANRRTSEVVNLLDSDSDDDSDDEDNDNQPSMDDDGDQKPAAVTKQPPPGFDPQLKQTGYAQEVAGQGHRTKHVARKTTGPRQSHWNRSRIMQCSVGPHNKQPETLDMPVQAANKTNQDNSASVSEQEEDKSTDYAKKSDHTANDDQNGSASRSNNSVTATPTRNSKTNANGDISSPTKRTPTRTVEEFEIGQRVYGEFPLNGQYYWGRITGKKKVNAFYRYDILFDDGDTASGLTAKKIFSEVQKKEFEKKSQLLIAEDLLTKACGECENCTKRACGNCHMCEQNRCAGARKLCCFQKMCIKIPEEQKVFDHDDLPKGYSFSFIERRSNPEFEGLVILSQGKRRFKAFENIKTQATPGAAARFYEYVGLIKTPFAHRNSLGSSSGSAIVLDTPKPRQQKARSSTGSLMDTFDGQPPAPYTPHQLRERSCGKCVNCTRPDCGSCLCCNASKRADSGAINCCFQRMCLTIPVELKAQQAMAGFPPGWRFAFDVCEKRGYEDLQGLVLLPPPPNQRRYFCVENAVNHNAKKLAVVDITLFYKSVGLNASRKRSASTGGNGRSVRPRLEADDDDGYYNTDEEVDVESLRDRLWALHLRRCRKCSQCKRANCTLCKTCKATLHPGGHGRVCLRKICCKIPESEKAQTAIGLPRGWKFYFTDPSTLTWNTSGGHSGQKKLLAGLVLLSPSGESFTGIESAAPFLGSTEEVDKIKLDFYAFIGYKFSVNLPHHILIGKGFCWKWVDVDGRNKILYGRCTKAETDTAKEVFVEVEYDESCLEAANAGTSSNGCRVPRTDKMKEIVALGGCLNFDPKALRSVHVPFSQRWHVPDIRREVSEIDEDGFFKPKLILHFREFQLVFTVKKSSIPNAGKGVWVTCTSMTNKKNALEFEAGELLDLGVYAPFRPQDKKREGLFQVKNFIHSSKCDEWLFEAKCADSVFDITDDVTGDIHAAASRHIPAYVNETDGLELPMIGADHDPEGCVHYLLGHLEHDHGPFQLPADGVPREVMIDYGPIYEEVRIRKNYSRLPPDEEEQKRRHFEEKDHLEYFAEMESFTAVEIMECITFISRDLFRPDRDFAVSVVARSLLATAYLRKLLEDWRDAEMYSNDSSTNIVDQKEKKPSQSEMQSSIETCDKLLRYFVKCFGCRNTLKKTLVKGRVYASCLEHILQQENVASLSPEELEEHFVRLLGF